MSFPLVPLALIRDLLPHWNERLLYVLVPVGEITLILLGGWLLRQGLRQVIRRLQTRYRLPTEVAVAVRRVGGFVIWTTTVLLVLGRLGVSGTVLWTAFTGFAAVGAVAFFAAWSVLSNIFCTFLIVTTRPFRLHDHIELLENGEKAGLKGKVVDINLIYTTLQEADEESVLQIPNSLFFQRTTRRRRDGDGFGAG
ncbi:MAG TPA: mechanosensitive ion channel family protein [Stenotrophomonas sp.]|jgi:small-conductance mechanosensitive channel